MNQKLVQYGPWVIGAAVVLFALSQWYGAQKQVAVMDAEIKAKDQQIEKLVKATEASERRVADLEERMNQREEETRRQLDALASVSRRAQTATPQEIAREVSGFLPVAPKVDQNTGAITITQQELRDLYAAGARMKAMEIELAAVKQDVVDLRATVAEKDVQIAQLREQVQLTAEQRDSAIKTAKGGGFWRRTATALKWIAVGVVAGVTLGRL